MREQQRAAGVGGLDRLDDGRVVVEEVVVRRQADQVGVLGRLQPALDVQVEVGAALDPARTRRADPEVEDRGAVLGVLGLSPDLDQRAEPERLGVVLDDHGDGLHGAHDRHAGPCLAENQLKVAFLPLVAGSRRCHDYCHDLLADHPRDRRGHGRRTIDLLLNDGRGPAAPPQSHFQDPQFTAPAATR